MKSLIGALVPEEEILRRLFKIAMYLDLPKPVQGIPVSTADLRHLLGKVLDTKHIVLHRLLMKYSLTWMSKVR